MRWHGMSDLAKIRDSCRAILARHQAGSYLDLSCVVCKQRVRGQESSMEHYATAHGIHTTHFDDIADLPGYFAHMRGLLFPGEGDNDNEQRVSCPQCREDCCNIAAWEAHVKEEGHSRWDTETIPTLLPFCVDSGNRSDDNEGEEENAHNIDECYDEDDNEEGDWNEEPAVCLFCDTVSTDPLAHMMEAHKLDFRAVIRAHNGVRDEYDAIRIVNVIRKSVVQGDCPYHYGMESAEGEMCRQDVVTSSLMAHLQAHPNHIIPRKVPTGDSELIPVLCGDAFISSVVMGGDLIANVDKDTKEKEEGSNDYPMVPTIAEMAKRWTPNTL